MAKQISLNLESKPSPGKNGGRRPGAGRKPDSSLHAGLTFQNLRVLQDFRATRRNLIQSIQGSERDPLLILLDFAVDRAKPDQLRVEAAGIACRYVHPVLSSAQVSMLHATVDPGRTLQVLTERLDRLVPPPAPAELPEPAPPWPQDAARAAQKAAEAVLTIDQVDEAAEAAEAVQPPHNGPEQPDPDPQRQAAWPLAVAVV